MDPSVEVMIFMGVILKIPVVFACWLIYWAVKSAPEVEEAPEDDGGHRYHGFRREPKRPGGPRRGPGAPDSMPLPCPEEGSLRVRGTRGGPRPLTAHGGERRH